MKKNMIFLVVAVVVLVIAVVIQGADIRNEWGMVVARTCEEDTSGYPPGYISQVWGVDPNFAGHFMYGEVYPTKQFSGMLDNREIYNVKREGDSIVFRGDIDKAVLFLLLGRANFDVTGVTEISINPPEPKPKNLTKDSGEFSPEFVKKMLQDDDLYAEVMMKIAQKWKERIDREFSELAIK